VRLPCRQTGSLAPQITRIPNRPEMEGAVLDAPQPHRECDAHVNYTAAIHTEAQSPDQHAQPGALEARTLPELSR
jgi:hypothetical protein